MFLFPLVGDLASSAQIHCTSYTLPISSGDFVRASKRVKRGALGPQSCHGTFSQGVYMVTARHRSLYDGVNYYKLKTWQDEKVPGRFYEPRLQKVQPWPNHWFVKKKLKYN